MKQIFKGSTYKLRVKNLEINPTSKKAITESITLNKNSLFYKNITGKMISLEYDTVLPTKEEAETNLNITLQNQEQIPEDLHCVYFNEDELIPYQVVNKKEFKILKKQIKK